MFNTLLAVFIGGGVGSMARWLVSLKLNSASAHLPVGTLIVNLVGAFIIGLTLAFFSRMTHIDPVWKLLITTGFVGPHDVLHLFCRSGLSNPRGKISVGCRNNFAQCGGFTGNDDAGFYIGQ